jgi:hypothetical protein
MKYFSNDQTTQGRIRRMVRFFRKLKKDVLSIIGLEYIKAQPETIIKRGFWREKLMLPIMLSS